MERPTFGFEEESGDGNVDLLAQLVDGLLMCQVQELQLSSQPLLLSGVHQSQLLLLDHSLREQRDHESATECSRTSAAVIRLFSSSFACKLNLWNSSNKTALF
jgi:hypothetical protein